MLHAEADAVDATAVEADALAAPPDAVEASPADEPTAVADPEPPTVESVPASTSTRSTPDALAHRRTRWLACVPDHAPCTRPRPARALLLSLGVLGGAAAAGLLFGLGDRMVQGGPAVMMVGASGLAGAGALMGMLAGRLGREHGIDDRLRPATASLAYGYRGPQILGESRPHAMSLRLAPNLFFPDDQGRLRLFGHVGGWLNPAREVDPRPQLAEAMPSGDGSAPAVLRQRHLTIGLGFDLAVALPYPVLAPRRSAHLGAAELRWRPEVQVRRDRFAPGTPDATLMERTMLLPLTVGTRWHLSPRQRFTVYFGPRFDLVAFSDPGSDRLRRGTAQLGPLYGEAWYDIDVPLNHHRAGHARGDGRARTVLATGQLSLGYVHSRFDGEGFNFGPVVGFLGPIHVGWSTRLRPIGAPVAAQLGAFARLGSGTTVGLELGLVAPDLHAKRRSRS